MIEELGRALILLSPAGSIVRLWWHLLVAGCPVLAVWSWPEAHPLVDLGRQMIVTGLGAH